MKKTPKFKSEAEERRFWQTHDSTEYVDWSKAKKVKLRKLEEKHRQGYLRKPAGADEFGV